LLLFQLLKMKKTLAAVLLPMLLALPFSASAEERELVPYQKLVETIKLDRFYALPPAQRDKIILYAMLTPQANAAIGKVERRAEPDQAESGRRPAGRKSAGDLVGAAVRSGNRHGIDGTT
jgi:hypothetical protein